LPEDDAQESAGHQYEYNQEECATRTTHRCFPSPETFPESEILRTPRVSAV
jgi:hypothetical protein